MLLFLGFNVRDFDFRIFFKGVVDQLKDNRRERVAILQLPPDLSRKERLEERREIETFLAKDLSNLKMQVLWTSIEDFLTELYRQGGLMLATTTTNPYVGPVPFKRGQKEYFFGRDQEEETLLSLVISERIVLFCAQSGVGKSSLVNALLIPGLEAEGYKVWPVIRVGGELPSGISPESVDNIYIFNTLWTLSGGAGSLKSLAQQKLKMFLKNNE